MKKEIKFSLVYRDMWQSSGKYQPRVDQLKQVAPLVIDMNCFARVETNGGAFEQVKLMAGENPNEAVREFTAPFNRAGIQTHMLDRGLNGLRMNPVPSDVRKLMYKVKKAQGVDITRIFCGLNDPRNIIPSIQYAEEGGMIPQAALCITHSPLHTVEYYVNLADLLIEAGAKEICLKDMAGIGRPVAIGQIIKEIRKRHPKIIIEYHGHSGPGFSVASMLEAAENGVDILDVAMEPLSWGMVHPDVITIQAMLKDAGYSVPEINMDAYMEARNLNQRFIDDFLGYFIDPGNKTMTSLLVGCGLPGGMMGSMMADLKGMHNAINLALKERGKEEVTLNNLLIQLFKEVGYIWPMLGYPPLVTPFSQYVKNITLMNILAMAKDEPRFSMIDKDSRNMILGKAGKLPGSLAPEIIEWMKVGGYEFYDKDPQTAFPDELNRFEKEMEENGWDEGRDREELFEFAMHERQYRDYKAGIANDRFKQESEQAKTKNTESVTVKRTTSEASRLAPEDVKASFPNAKPVCAPLTGQVLWQYDVIEPSSAPFAGTHIDENDNLCYVQNFWGIEPIHAGFNGTIIGTFVKQGERVQKGQILAFIN